MCGVLRHGVDLPEPSGNTDSSVRFNADDEQVVRADERFNKFERERAREDAKRQKDEERAYQAHQREAKRLEGVREKERKAEEKRKVLEDKKR